MSESILYEQRAAVTVLTLNRPDKLNSFDLPMHRMEKIPGRSDDMMIVRGVNVFPTQIEEPILTQAARVPHCLCVLTPSGRTP